MRVNASLDHNLVKTFNVHTFKFSANLIYNLVLLLSIRMRFGGFFVLFFT